MSAPADLLTDTRLADLVARTGAGREVRRRWVGATSTVLQLGSDLAVKVPHDDPEAVRVCLLHAEVCRSIRRLGVRAPEVLEVRRLPGWPVPVVVGRLLPGDALVAGATPTAVWRAVGAELALLHAAPARSVPPGLRTFTQHRAVDPTTVVETLEQEGRLTPATARRLAALRDDLAPRVLPRERPVLCHGDLHAGNVIALDGAFSGLVDFAGTGWLDAGWDFAAVPRSAVGPLLTGYGDAGGETAGLPPRLVWCRFQLAVHRLPPVAAPEAEALEAARRAEELLTRLGG